MTRVAVRRRDEVAQRNRVHGFTRAAVHDDGKGPKKRRARPCRPGWARARKPSESPRGVGLLTVFVAVFSLIYCDVSRGRSGPCVLSRPDRDAGRPLSSQNSAATVRAHARDSGAARRAGRALVVADVVRQNVADVQVNYPVHEAETDEANGEHHSGVLVDIGRADAK